MDINEILAKVALFYVPFLFALCFHEYAHGWVARRLGDPTAEMMGRLTLNPVSHMDVLGTVVFPLMAIIGSSPLFFGWAKPVPVMERNLKNPRKDMFWIALAGPASNIFLAVIGTVLLGARNYLPLSFEHSQLLLEGLRLFIIINLFLAVFNLIPVHPLDGGKIMARFLPYETNRWLEENSGMISMGLFALILIDGMGGGTMRIISAPVYFLYNVLEGTVGRIFLYT